MDSISKSKLYSSFYSSIPKTKKIKSKSDVPFKVKAASLAGSGIGAGGAAYLLSKFQNAGTKIKPGIFNVKYREPQIIAVAVASVIGGFIGGCLTDDKKHVKAKTREGIHQIVANIIAPLALIGALQKVYKKISPKIKLPQFKPDNNIKKAANYLINISAPMILTLTGLVSGVFIGTIVSNKINKTENTPNERKVKIGDFIYHPDDVVTVLALSDNSAATQKIVGKIIPPIFVLSGYEAGVEQ